MIRFLYLALVILVTPLHAQYIPKFDVQGQRGANDLTLQPVIYAFTTALDSGVTTIKMEVAITKDKRVILSPQPWMSLFNCSQPDSVLLSRKDGKFVFNIYKMKYEEILFFDCGSKGNLRFPNQEKIAASRPLLRDVIVGVENHIRSYTTYEVDYAIEIKSTKTTDGKFHPSAEEYSDLVYQLVDQYLPLERIVIQSADFRVLKYWHKKYPKVRLCALVDNTKSVAANLNDLGFSPSIYSVNYKVLKQSQVRELRDRRIRVIPWTVNEIGEMKKLKDWGVDGFITEYPKRASQLGFGLKLNTSKTGSR